MNMMNGGWPMKMMMKMKSGKECPEPEEEEEEELEVEDWPEYYEEEMMEDQNAWDTNPVPVYSPFDDKRTPDKRKRGDDFDDPGSIMKNRIEWLKVKNPHSRIHDRPRHSFEYDFEYS
ncbi:hypothetical protein TNCV_5072091 [Trichonephila clavipes]|nr:hypothetical protein TNCV_5072091 [Trichonephila clavipes]